MKIDPDKSVFINCPYDAQYAPLFEAILFATVCCSFVPRSAIESATVAEPRMERIVRALFQSRYSIHDLSRNRGVASPNPRQVLAALPGFRRRRRQLGIDWGGEVPWDLVVLAAGEHVPKL